MKFDHERFADPNYKHSGAHGSSPHDPERCRWSVHATWSRWPQWHQCSRKAVVDGLWCRQHSPEETRKREAAKDIKFKASQRKFMDRIHAAKMRAALEAIASGELNDPVGYAAMKLEEFDL